jgi:hypothetical protein
MEPCGMRETASATTTFPVLSHGLQLLHDRGRHRVQFAVDHALDALIDKRPGHYRLRLQVGQHEAGVLHFQQR